MKRKCLNPFCSEKFDGNPKKKYCGLTCKNKMNYSNKKFQLSFENEQTRERIRLLKLLEELFNNGCEKIALDFLITSLKFNPTIFQTRYKCIDLGVYVRIGNYCLAEQNDGFYAIIKILNDNGKNKLYAGN